MDQQAARLSQDCRLECPETVARHQTDGLVAAKKRFRQAKLPESTDPIEEGSHKKGILYLLLQRQKQASKLIPY